MVTEIKWEVEKEEIERGVKVWRTDKEEEKKEERKEDAKRAT